MHFMQTKAEQKNFYKKDSNRCYTKAGQGHGKARSSRTELNTGSPASHELREKQPSVGEG